MDKLFFCIALASLALLSFVFGVHDTCTLRYERGNCKKPVPRFYFDRASKVCRPFIYSGCKGNANNFASEEDCQYECGCFRNKTFYAKGESFKDVTDCNNCLCGGKNLVDCTGRNC